MLTVSGPVPDRIGTSTGTDLTDYLICPDIRLKMLFYSRKKLKKYMLSRSSCTFSGLLNRFVADYPAFSVRPDIMQSYSLSGQKPDLKDPNIRPGVLNL